MNGIVPKAQNTISKVMKDFKDGPLKSGSAQEITAARSGGGGSPERSAAGRSGLTEKIVDAILVGQSEREQNVFTLRSAFSGPSRTGLFAHTRRLMKISDVTR